MSPDIILKASIEVFIDNFKEIFVCSNKILEDTIENNLLKLRKLLTQIL